MEAPVVLIERNLYGHTLEGLFWERQFVKILLMEMFIRTSSKRIIIVCVYGSHQIDWKETKTLTPVETTQQRSRFGRFNIFP